MIRKMRWWNAKAEREMENLTPDEAEVEKALDHACAAACAAAPYVHPKLTAVALTKRTENIKELTDAELNEIIMEARPEREGTQVAQAVVDLLPYRNETAV